jgi:hypothetical protein
MGISRMLGCVLAIGIAVLPAVGQASAIQEGVSDGPTVNVIFGKVKNKVQKAFSHGLPQVDFHRGRLLPKVHISKGDKARNAVHKMGIGLSTAKYGGKTDAHTPPGTPVHQPSTSLAEHRRLQKADAATSKPHTCPTCGGPTGRPTRRHSM